MAPSAPAQLRVQPVGEYPNDAALKLMLRKLQTTGTFMQATAHPDDEDNVLLAMLGHGAGMRTVLVSATRGEGGQNEIGPELFEALSVLRTEEILAAHRFDGAEQLFTRAVDFGFSFSVEENLQKWGRDEIAGDYVRHIRATRPHVVAAFVCGGEGGGQAHQASTVLTIQAIRDAADPSKYTEQIREGLRPWRVMRLFCTQGFGRRQGEPGLLSIDGHELDPVIGRTYAELGTEARSMHRCQGTSQLLPLPGAGQGRIYKLLEAGEPPQRPLASMFDGIDTSIAGLARFAGGNASIVSALRAIAAAAASADLITGLRQVRSLRSMLAPTRSTDAGHDEIDFRMAQKERQFEQALVLSKRMRFEAIADDGIVAPGQRVRLTLIADRQEAAPGPVKASVSGFAVQGGCAPGPGTSAVVKCDVEAVVPERAGLTSPYWRAAADAARYVFEPGVPFGLPFTPSPFRATFELAIDGESVRVERPIEYRYSDPVAGEKRMELHVVPAFGVAVSPDIVVVPKAAASDRRERRSIRVSVVNNTKGAASGTVRLHAPAGWRVEPATAAAAFAREDESVTVPFAIEAPAGAASGEFPIEASFTAERGTESRDGYQVIEYPHTHRRHIVRRAAARLKIVDARMTSGLRVGYVMGVGDQVPQAIAQLGAAVQLIGPDELAGGDLSSYDVIVTGVRAYERRADLRANNHRLLAYAERGGTVLVQYNKFEFNDAQYGPYPAKVSAQRVTDENTPVEVLVPAHPVFTKPNRIGPESWAGWVQERGLYFLGDRDPRYVDLLRMTDPFPYNPGPKTGALVEAKVGRGRWIYIGLGLWRQLPAGTDGAYRLLANLLSLRQP